MNSKEYREFLEAYNGIYEQVRVPADATDAEALKGLIPKGEKVHEIPRKKPPLQNASYEPEGEMVDEGLGKAILGGAAALAGLAAGGNAMKPKPATQKARPGTIQSNVEKRNQQLKDLLSQSNELEGEEYLDEAGAPSGKNYGDPVAAKWNKDLASFNTKGRSREMTPPSIPRGYAYNPQAGTITRGGAAPTSATAKPRPTAPATPASRNLRGLSVGPGGFNINNKPVRTTPPVTPNARRDPEFRTSGPGVGNVTRPAATRPAAAATRPAAPATRPAATTARPTAPVARPAATAPVKPSAPVSKPAATAPKPVTQPAETRTQASAGEVRGMVGSSMARQAATSTPQLSARAQALKTGGPQGGARSRVLNQDLDLFDIIKGHLLDEGFADTEESALVIMANMSEEWRNSIVETNSITDLKKKIEVEKLKGQLETERNKRYAAAELKPGSYGVPSYARHAEQQKEYEHQDAGLTKAQSRQILAQNRRSLEAAAGVKTGSTEKDAWYNDPNYGKQLTGKGKFFSPRTVLAKQGGKEGKLTVDPNTGKKTFTATQWTGAEKGRYSSKGGK